MGNLELGEKVWYNCPSCGEEKWAYEGFANVKCWKCRGHQEIADKSNAELKKTDPDFFNRRERFVTMSNGKPLHPKSSYKYSNFRTLYKKVSIDDISDDDILNILKAEVPSLLNTYTSSKNATLSEKCVELWTCASPLYRQITKMLIYDDFNKLQKFMPIIRGITACIIRPSDVYRETYRGSKLFMIQFDSIKVGTTYRISQMLATSTDKSTAQGFLEGDGVMVKFKIPKGRYATPISKYSAIPSEDEVLFPPYTAIKITYKSKANKVIECQVVDNLSADQNAESRVL